MNHPAARLVSGFVALVLVGWAVGELWLSIVGSGDLDAVRDVTDQRTATLTEIAKVVTWAGSGFLLVPLALICCLEAAFAFATGVCGELPVLAPVLVPLVGAT